MDADPIRVAVNGFGVIGKRVAGAIAAQPDRVLVVVDATPKGVAAANLPSYLAANVDVVVPGGKPHEPTGHSFVAQANPESARWVLLRRATDLWASDHVDATATVKRDGHGAVDAAKLRPGPRSGNPVAAP